MVFFSLQFASFLLVLLALYYGAGRLFPRYQWVVLLVGSIAFYLIMGGWPAIIFMVVTALATWGGSHLMARFSAQANEARKAAKGREEKKAVKAAFARKRRLVLVGVLAVTLGMLGYLKYWNTILFNFGLAESTHSLGIMLPLGISFYTFISLGYLIDVYNEKYGVEPNFARFFLYVSWFPQILQGPINRFDAISSQLFAERHADWYGMRRGLLRMGYGFFKKYGIANVLVGNYLAVFSHVTESTPSPAILTGILLYTVYMYADFSGGIDIVEGASELFGIEMAPNFRQPYFSTSLAGYWRRWHMSLGAWMRDYVFYPLAVCKPMRSLNRHATKALGKQIGRTIAACVANVVVFVIVGLWHGAEWHFLAWGLYNGIIIALSDLLAPTFDRISERLHINKEAIWYRIFAIIRTMTIVSIGRFFDCIEGMDTVWLAMRDTVCNLTAWGFKANLEEAGVTFADTLGFAPIVIVACVVVFIISLCYERGIDVRATILSQRLSMRVALYLVLGVIFFISMSFAINVEEVFLYAFF